MNDDLEVPKVVKLVIVVTLIVLLTLHNGIFLWSYEAFMSTIQLLSIAKKSAWLSEVGPDFAELLIYPPLTVYSRYDD